MNPVVTNSESKNQKKLVISGLLDMTFCLASDIGKGSRSLSASVDVTLFSSHYPNNILSLWLFACPQVRAK